MKLKYFHFKWKALAALLFFVLLPGMASSENQSNASETPGTGASTTLDFANGLYARKMYGPAIGEYEKFIKTNPASPEIASARFRYADSRYFTKNYAEAVSSFEAFILDFPKDSRVSMALFRVGTSRYYMNDFAPAVRVFTNILKETPDTAIKSGSLFYLSKCYDAKKKSEKALNALEQLVKNYPTSEYASYAGLAVGDHYLELKRYDEAIKAYQVAAGKNSPPEIAKEALFKSAEIYFSSKDYMGARDNYDRLFQKTLDVNDLPENAKKRNTELRDKAVLGLFYCDFNLQDLDSAQKRFEAQKEAVAANPHKAEILYLLANLLADKKNYDQAVKYLDEVINGPSTDNALKEKAIFKKASVLALQDKKEVSLQEIEKLFGGTSPNLGRAYFEKAEILKAMNRDAEAISQYKTVIEKYPDTDYAKAALYQSSFLYQKTGDLKSARQNFVLYANKYASDANAENALLQIIQIDLTSKNFKAASQNAWIFIQKHPESSFLDIAYYKLGVSLTGMRQYKHAALAFGKLLVKYPNSKLYAEAIYGAAVNAENSGDAPKALLIYEKLTQNYPQHALSKEALVRMAYLYIQTKDYEKLNAVYQELLFNRPDVPLDTDGVFWLVRWLLNKGDYASMQKILEVLPKRFPGKNLDHEINFFLGESAMGMKDYAKAVGSYSKAVAAKKDGVYAPEAFLGLGLAYGATNDAVSAEKNFNEVLSYDYSRKMTMRARFEIANLHLKAGRIEEAAKGFMLVAILYDDPKYTPLSLYKAAECFKKLNQTDEANKALSELTAHYPSSPWAKKVIKKSTEATHV